MQARKQVRGGFDGHCPHPYKLKTLKLCLFTPQKRLIIVPRLKKKLALTRVILIKPCFSRRRSRNIVLWFKKHLMDSHFIFSSLPKYTHICKFWAAYMPAMPFYINWSSLENNSRTFERLKILSSLFQIVFPSVDLRI